MYHTYRKTATVEAKLFEPGDEDGLAIPDENHLPSFLKGNPEAWQPGMEIPYLSTLENQRHFGLFGRYYVCNGIEGERWLVEKDIFEKTYERVDKD